MKFEKVVYENVPVWAQNVACTIKGYLEKKSRLGGEFKSILNKLEVSQWMNEEAIVKNQLNELKKILTYSYENIPYYKELFDKIKFDTATFKSIQELERIPILTKELVRQNYEKLKNPNFKGEIVHAHTSGSTGKSLNFDFSKDAIQYRWALWFRHKSRFGVKPYDSYATFTGLPAVPLNQNKAPYWRENRALKQTIFTMHHINTNTVPSIVGRLNKGGFVYYSGYPSILFALALLIEDLRLEIFQPPKIIFTGAEALLDYQRKKISSIFKCPVTDQYGFSEGCGNASRCEEDLFHEDFEYGLLECVEPIINAHGTRTGKVIATGFTNLAMPFIRYEVGDTATWIDSKCKCGRESKTILLINGRNEDFVVTPEGNNILRFDYIFKNTKSISEAQIIQKELGGIVIKVVKRNDYNKEKMELFLKKEVKSKISQQLNVSFEYVDSIERESTGKFRAVKSYL
jgi:phenylacetate-CoA ligase